MKNEANKTKSVFKNLVDAVCLSVSPYGRSYYGKAKTAAAEPMISPAAKHKLQLIQLHYGPRPHSAQHRFGPQVPQSARS